MDEENDLIWINSKRLQIHIHMYVCVCVCVCIYIYIYIYTRGVCVLVDTCVCVCGVYFLKTLIWKFPGSPVVKTQHGFNPWLGN